MADKKEGPAELYNSKKRKWKRFYFKADATAAGSLQYFKDKKMTKVIEEKKKNSFVSVKMVEFPPKDGQFVFEIQFIDNTPSWVISVPTNDERSKWMETLLPKKLTKSDSEAQFDTAQQRLRSPSQASLALEYYYPVPYPVPICMTTTTQLINNPPYPIQSKMPTPTTVIASIAPPYPLSPSSAMPQPAFFAATPDHEMSNESVAWSNPMHSPNRVTTPSSAMPCSPVSPMEFEVEKFQFPPAAAQDKQDPSPYLMPNKEYYTENDGYVVMGKRAYDKLIQNTPAAAPIGFDNFVHPFPHTHQNIPEMSTSCNDTSSDVCIISNEADHRISSSSLTNKEIIGKGNFGEVFKADYSIEDSGERIKVAVKTLKSGNSNKVATKETLREFAVMATMVHPNIVRLYGVVLEDDTNPWIVLEYFSFGDLKSYLKKSPKKPVGTLVKYMIDIAMGMHYIAQKGLIHRDLAARNVLVGEGEICKVADFGLLRELPSDMSIYQSQSLLPLPIRWMPPEAISERLFSEASDVWSYGVLQWELFNPYTLPYKGMSNEQVCTKVAEGYRLPIPEECPHLVAKLMESCWHREPNKRPSFLQITSSLTRKM